MGIKRTKKKQYIELENNNWLLNAKAISVVVVVGACKCWYDVGPNNEVIFTVVD
jgi:hypothetical protein